MTYPGTASDRSFLEGGGELGALMRAYDWTRTPLGEPGKWPQSLKTAVRIMLTSRQPIWLGWGPELTYLYNDPYKSIIGGKHPAALGRPFSEVWREIWDVVGPMADTVMTRDEGTYVEAQMLIMERHGYQEETYYTFSYSPVPNDEGGPGGLICANTDDTRRVIGERQLALLSELAARTAAARRWQDACDFAMAALQTSPRDIPFALLFVAGAEGNPLTVAASSPGAQSLRNPALWPCTQVMRDGQIRLTALDGSQGALPTGAWARAPREAAVLPIAASAGTGGHEGVLVVGLNPFRQFDDSYRDFLMLVARQVAAGIANAEAYEKEKQRAEALAELDQAKTAFFSNVSHEFRTPLTLMLGPIEDLLLRAPSGAPDETRDLLNVVHRNGQRLLKLVNTLLDFARIEAGRAQAAYEPTDLARLTADLASNFRSACERAGICLRVDCPPLQDAAYVDHEMYEKIVLNLLSNAFKFTLAGEIGVALRETPENFELRVSDTGTGIPPEALPRMFERFIRVPGARGRSHEGSGIGLALVQELIKLHGGTITVASELDRGTTFTVCLPKGSGHLPADRIRSSATHRTPAERAGAYVDEALSWLPQAPAATGIEPRSAQRVLLADDNADLREYARRLLAEHYEVEAVADGEAALAAARARRPDIIVSDVMMPRLDGFGLIRQLRADPALRAIPVILLSARAGEEARIEGLGKGADDYLVKPFSSRELLVRVGTLVQSAQAHRRASEALAQFETLLNHAPLGVYLVDDALRIAAVNPVGRPAFGDIPDLIGRDFREVMRMIWPEAYVEKIVSRFRRTLETGEPDSEAEHIEQRVDRKVTEFYEWQIHRIPLPGDRFGVVCYFRDISKSVLAREALREADRRKDEFLATLSHELRNPLAPLRNALQLLQLAGKDAPSIAPVQQIMERQVNHLVRLVDDLLEISRISRGTVELRKERVEVGAVVRNALETSQPLIQASAHELSLSLPAAPIWIEGDAVRLAQILSNLLNNAATYTERGGHIWVTASRKDGSAVVSVRDDGPGIVRGQLESIFEMFSRGERSTSRAQGGLGIGLALARSLAQMHGGSLSVASAGPGQGAEFTLRIPLAADSPPQHTAPSAPPDVALSRKRILVVDDNHDAADSLGRVLEILGADVRLAGDGAEALRVFETYDPQVVVLDIGMPGMDGYEVARRIRGSYPRHRAALVALTGWGQEEDRRRARDAGFDHHLVKPAEIAALQKLLAEL